jgi:hypothetical protein
MALTGRRAVPWDEGSKARRRISRLKLGEKSTRKNRNSKPLKPPRWPREVLLEDENSRFEGRTGPIRTDSFALPARSTLFFRGSRRSGPRAGRLQRRQPPGFRASPDLFALLAPPFGRLPQVFTGKAESFRFLRSTAPICSQAGPDFFVDPVLHGSGPPWRPEWAQIDQIMGKIGGFTTSESGHPPCHFINTHIPRKIYLRTNRDMPANEAPSQGLAVDFYKMAR